LYNLGKDEPLTSLVLPTYNPGAAIERTWDQVRDFLRARPDPWEVLFVLDGCTDDTRIHLERLQNDTNEPRIRILSYSPNQGKGHAVRVGLLEAKGTYRLFTDVDLAYGFDDIARLADELRGGAQAAIASREHPESLVQLPPQTIGYAYRRRLQSQLFGRVARMILPLTQHDTQAGLKGMTAEVAQRILPNLRCNGFGFDCEFLTACARYGIPVQEMPVNVRYENAASTTGSGTALKMLRELWQIRQYWPAKGFPEPRSVVSPRSTSMERAA
jgi:dolichyl-phosphate beta-glucosyltransferase